MRRLGIVLPIFPEIAWLPAQPASIDFSSMIKRTLAELTRSLSAWQSRRHAADGFTLSRFRDAQAFAALFAAHEPRSSHAIGLALHHGLESRTTRCMLIHDRAGSLAGAVIVHRWMLNQWLAVPVLIDAGAAAAVARYVDRGPANVFHTNVSHAEAMKPLMERPQADFYERVAQMAHPIEWGDPDPHCRWARPSDVDALVELFWPSSLNGLPNKWVLRRFLRKSLDSIIVYDPGDGTGPIGLFERVTKTPNWWVGGGMVVHPDHREKGISWALLGFGVAEANAAGVGGQVFARDSNPMSIPADTMVDDDFLLVTLRPPRRFKGEPRIHRLIERVSMQSRRSEALKSFSRDRIDRSRRTQQAWKSQASPEA